jgi:WD40 repeat protein
MFIFPSASRDLQVWSTNTFKRIYQIPLRKTLLPGTEIISISPDSNLLAVTSRGAPIDLWSLPTGQHVSAVEVYNQLSSAVFLFIPNLRYLAFNSNTSYISI